MDAKAEALASLAFEVSKRNKERAWNIVDRAFDTYLDQPAGPNRGFFPVAPVFGRLTSRPADAARIANTAKAIEYPDMTSIVDRALALRPTPQASGQAAGLVESTLNMARLLALVDPRIAEELLHSIESQTPLAGTANSSVKRGDWLLAWALVDFERAKKMFVDELTAQQRQNPPELIESGLLPMLELLALPQEDRKLYLVRSIFNRS